jgi:hypothetical protein
LPEAAVFLPPIYYLSSANSRLLILLPIVILHDNKIREVKYMFIYLIIMYLLSLIVAYAAAFDCSIKALWISAGNNDMPGPLQHVLNPPWQRALASFSYCASFIGIGYGFLRLGLFAGAGIAFCFVVASKIGEMVLLHKMGSAFHLNIILRAILRKQADYLLAGDMALAKSMECLIDKVAMKLYALKAVKSATLVPAYAGYMEHLKVINAKADNYYRCSRTQKGS